MHLIAVQPCTRWRLITSQREKLTFRFSGIQQPQRMRRCGDGSSSLLSIGRRKMDERNRFVLRPPSHTVQSEGPPPLTFMLEEKNQPFSLLSTLMEALEPFSPSLVGASLAASHACMWRYADCSVRCSASSHFQCQNVPSWPDQTRDSCLRQSEGAAELVFFSLLQICASTRPTGLRLSSGGSPFDLTALWYLIDSMSEQLSTHS